MLDIFENPLALLTAAIVALLIVLILRRVSPDKRHWWQWFLPVFLAAAAFGLDILVQTDAEQINAVINTGVKAVEEENPDAIGTIISEDYRDSYHHTKKTLMNHCRARLSQPLVDRAIKRILSIQVSPPAATAILTVRMIFDRESYVYQSFKREMLIKIKLALQKEQDGRWRINRAEILEIDRQPAKWQNIR